ncbi:MAG: hypothetical protein WC749_11600 [Dehalococcoidia bacterium]
MKGLNIARLLGKLNIALSDERGLGVVESLVAVGILGIGVTGAVIALATGAMTVDTVDQEANLQSVATSQLAYTKSCLYDPAAITYPAVDHPADYPILVEVFPVPDADDNIQMIRVTVSRTDSDSTLVVEDFKVNRQ